MHRRIFALVFVVVAVAIPTMAGSVPGGMTPLDKDSKEVQDLVNKAVTKYNSESNSLYYHVPVEVLSAESQVVAGVLYKIKITLGQSGCLKNQVGAADFDVANCAEDKKDARKELNIKIWSKPWEDFEEITFE